MTIHKGQQPNELICFTYSRVSSLVNMYNYIICYLKAVILTLNCYFWNNYLALNDMY